MYLKVDTVWCSKCKMCRSVSQGKIEFGADHYPAAGEAADADIEQIRRAEEFCPIGALALN